MESKVPWSFSPGFWREFHLHLPGVFLGGGLKKTTWAFHLTGGQAFGCLKVQVFWANDPTIPKRDTDPLLFTFTAGFFPPSRECWRWKFAQINGTSTFTYMKYDKKSALDVGTNISHPKAVDMIFFLVGYVIDPWEGFHPECDTNFVIWQKSEAYLKAPTKPSQKVWLTGCFGGIVKGYTTGPTPTWWRFAFSPRSQQPTVPRTPQRRPRNPRPGLIPKRPRRPESLGTGEI